jgi:hypothetical protein
VPEGALGIPPEIADEIRAGGAGTAPAPATPSAGQAPLVVRSNPMLGRYRATVACIVHDEMYFLPAFLDHYRRLGVDRFVVLDDRSTDGTAEFLGAQPDVMVVESAIRYFEEIGYPPEARGKVRELRAVRLWRDQIMDQFCTGQWALVVDPDEFLAIPGDDLPAFLAALEAEGAEAAWGVMVDMYPAKASDILGDGADAGGAAPAFSLAGPWYFDGRPHLDPDQPRESPAVPRMVYPGSVARLFATWKVLPQGTRWQQVKRRISGFRYEPSQMIHKTPIVFWKSGDWFLNCHLTSKPVSRTRIVPMMHFKFTTDLGRKIAYALGTGGYNQGSRSYRLYAALLARMRDADGSFLAPVSRRYASHRDFLDTGVAR